MDPFVERLDHKATYLNGDKTGNFLDLCEEGPIQQLDPRVNKLARFAPKRPIPKDIFVEGDSECSELLKIKPLHASINLPEPVQSYGQVESEYWVKTCEDIREKMQKDQDEGRFYDLAGNLIGDGKLQCFYSGLLATKKGVPVYPFEFNSKSQQNAFIAMTSRHCGSDARIDLDVLERFKSFSDRYWKEVWPTLEQEIEKQFLT